MNPETVSHPNMIIINCDDLGYRGLPSYDFTVMNIDWFPTLLALAGVELPIDRIIDGKTSPVC